MADLKAWRFLKVRLVLLTVKKNLGTLLTPLKDQQEVLVHPVEVPQEVLVNLADPVEDVAFIEDPMNYMR